ncbi:MAG: preprotein translocase subunit SecY [Bacilli bacterium]|nr:preprotein translocase subunit SecY [Bacilli bacterium]
MFKNLKQVFSPRNKDIRNKILFTLLILFVYKIGTAVRVPGTENITQDLGFLELLNVMGGGSLRNFSIFALGVTPYISASIIIQLMQMDIIPYFSNLAKEGHTGRVKLNKITRYLGIAFAFLQGLVMSFSFLGEGATAIEYLRVSLILTAGTCFLLWLGDQITQKGVGNGISMLIMAGILISTPAMMVDAFGAFVVSGTTQEVALGVTKFILFLLVYVAIIIGVVYIEKSERRIPVQYSNRTSTAYGAKQTYIPFKLNSAGVMPVIFASSLISIPSLLATFIKSDSFSLFVNSYINYNTVTGFMLYILLIILFTYLYTFMASGLRPKELADNLNKNGGYIPGVRPGNETKNYVSTVLSRTTFLGALFLIIIAGLPIIFSNVSSLPTSVTVGGTGLLIVVGVALETYNQIESSLSARQYERGYRK